MHFTQIGSLPFDDIEEALDYSFQHSIPFVPDLPAISPHEFMLEQARQSITKPYKQICLEPFIKRLTNYNGIIKNQLPGPLCISQYLGWELNEAFRVWKTMLINRIDTFKSLPNPIWMFIDEPSFFDHSIELREFVFKELNEVNDIFFAIHYCGKTRVELTNWPDKLGLSFDKSLHSDINHKAQISGIRAGIELVNNPIAITPACGLWGEPEPLKVLELLKSVAE